MKKQVISLKVDPDQLARLDAAAEAAGLNRSEYILTALDGAGVPAQPPPRPEGWEERVQARIKQLDPQGKTPNHSRKLAIRDVELEDLEADGKKPWEGKSVHIHTQPRLDASLTEEERAQKVKKQEAFSKHFE